MKYDPVGLLQTMKYDPVGRLIEQQLGWRNVEFRPDPYRPDAQVDMQAAIQRCYRYDRSGKLTSIDDTRRGHIEYRYDPIGRLTYDDKVSR
ncbi:RHS repeat domain-containing protein [Pseudoduganella armeniaca]|uniref:RHS repeat protein n=1 Tax=Pseudoduganella armeniaca TaxID=2072590 RepID=A0A2R4CCF8_9BURK|nr:RHS repeat domain-containing protein [Pseudoduganella armeniaca]AVR97317.1 hypothetical protein C9I28_17950 [Pseudoduganella armeniaca]